MSWTFDTAKDDIVEGFVRWELWTRLGAIEIRRRYKRTIIGPFWTTLSMAIFTTSVGVVFSYLWKMPIADYLPFLCSGLIAWGLVSTLIIESGQLIISFEGVLKQFRFPITTFACLNVWRNLVVLLHNLVVFVFVALIFPVDINLTTLLFFPGVFLIAVNGVWVSILFGLLAARYRDIQPITSSLLQMAILVTPIFWPPEQVGHWRVFLVEPNVLYHFVEMIRSPLLGQAPAALSWYMVLGTTVIGWAVAFVALARMKHRVIFWV